MSITINTEILSRHNLTLGEFLLLLVSYYDVDYPATLANLIDKKLLEANLFKNLSAVMSDNTKNMIAKILVESNEKIVNSHIDYGALANVLRSKYPSGVKPGTTYAWRGTTEEIVQKLQTLVAVHNFHFTPQEAISAVQEYVSSFEDPAHMCLLKNFLLTTTKNDMKSHFMTIIENNRNESKESNT